jgi:outer membrane biosynthesis protein TonB
MATASPVVDHDQIKQWVETRGGRPACVKGTRQLLRIDFTGDESLQPVAWDEWFATFEGRNLAALLGEEPESRFMKLVSRETGEDAEPALAQVAPEPAPVVVPPVKKRAAPKKVAPKKAAPKAAPKAAKTAPAKAKKAAPKKKVAPKAAPKKKVAPKAAKKGAKKAARKKAPVKAKKAAPKKAKKTARKAARKTARRR